MPPRIVSHFGTPGTRPLCKIQIRLCEEMEQFGGCNIDHSARRAKYKGRVGKDETEEAWQEEEETEGYYD